MKRAHREPFSSSIVFVDSSGSCDQTNTSVTFVFGKCKAGAIPLGYILHTSQQEENYYHAFSALMELVGSAAFNGKGAPEIIMTDDSEAERNACKRVFPNATLLLCIFHVCQAVWRWLWDSKNGIDKNDRQHLMILFRRIMYANEEEDCDSAFSDLMDDPLSQKYPNFRRYIGGLW